MTEAEKFEMYLEKKKFIENVNEVFQMDPRCPSIEGVHYEVHTKDYGEGRIDVKEWLIVHYTGGGWAPKIVSGNSNIANFKVIGSMLQGGCYDEVRTYQEMEASGHTKVEL